MLVIGLRFLTALKATFHPILNLTIHPFSIGKAFIISVIFEENMRDIHRKDKKIRRYCRK